MRCELCNPLIAFFLDFILLIVRHCCSAIFLYRWFHLGGKCVAEHTVLVY